MKSMDRHHNYKTKQYMSELHLLLHIKKACALQCMHLVSNFW